MQGRKGKVYPNNCRFLKNNTRDDFTCGHHQVINTEMKLIAFFVAKDGEAIHSQQKQNLELWLRSSASHGKIQA